MQPQLVVAQGIQRVQTKSGQWAVWFKKQAEAKPRKSKLGNGQLVQNTVLNAVQVFPKLVRAKELHKRPPSYFMWLRWDPWYICKTQRAPLKNKHSVSWQNARIFMPTTTAIKNNGVALANPDSKIHLVTNTIGAYYANSNLGMAKSRNTRLGRKKTIPGMPEQYSNLISCTIYL